MLFRKMLIAALLFLGLLSIVPVAEASETNSNAQIGKVLIGTDGTYPPFNYMNDKGELTGFEIEMVREISKRTGLDVEFRTLPWDGIFGQMESKKIDTVLCCIFPNADRQKKYDFSREYIYDVNAIIVRKGDGAKYRKFEDLAGLKIGCAGGGNSILNLEKLKKKVDFEIVAYSDEKFPYDLALGRLDAMYKSPVSAFMQAKQNNWEFELTQCPPVEEGSCALPWRKGDERSAMIRRAFSKATQEMIDDGTMKALCEQWLGLDETAYKPLFDFE